MGVGEGVDTYFDATQLRRLLAHTLPADAYDAIGDVVCSSEQGLCKSQGLFKLARLNLEANAEEVLHVGDNKDADVRAPKALGMLATWRHLLQRGVQAAREPLVFIGELALSVQRLLRRCR